MTIVMVNLRLAACGSRASKDVGHGALDPGTQAEQAAEWIGFVMRELAMTFPVGT